LPTLGFFCFKDYRDLKPAFPRSNYSSNPTILGGNKLPDTVPRPGSSKEPLFDENSHGDPRFNKALDAPQQEPLPEPMVIDLVEPQPKSPQKHEKALEQNPDECMQKIVRNSSQFIRLSNMKQTLEPRRSDSPRNLPTDYGVEDGEPETEEKDDEETEDDLPS